MVIINARAGASEIADQSKTDYIQILSKEKNGGKLLVMGHSEKIGPDREKTKQQILH